MTTLDVVSSRKKKEPMAEELAAVEVVRLAQEQGLSLTGPDGRTKQFTKTVLETALNDDLTEHLGHEKHHAPDDRDGTNVRNGTRPKTVLTEATGEVTIEVPRDRDGTFEPVIVRKRQRRLTGVDEIVLSPSTPDTGGPGPRSLPARFGLPNSDEECSGEVDESFTGQPRRNVKASVWL